MAQEGTENRRVTFRIEAHLGVMSTGKDGFTKELNLVSWNGSPNAKYDIRGWSKDHKKMTKGITLYGTEMDKLCQYYLDYCNARTVAVNKSRRNAAAAAGLKAGEEEREREELEEKAEVERMDDTEEVSSEEETEEEEPF